MGKLKIVSDQLDHNWISLKITIPARRNGALNTGALAALMTAAMGVNPDAYDPDEVPAAQLAHNDGHTADGGGVIPADLAAVMLRDGVIEFSPEEPPLRACPTGGCGLD